MKLFRRPIFNALVVLSLLFLLATVMFWFAPLELISVEPFNPKKTVGHEIVLMSVWGGDLYVGTLNYSSSKNLGRLWPEAGFHVLTFEQLQALPVAMNIYSRWPNPLFPSPSYKLIYRVPYVLGWAALLFAILPLVWCVKWFKGRKRAMAGKCTKCDYDLTGNTTGKCPECGTAVSLGKAASS